MIFTLVSEALEALMRYEASAAHCQRAGFSHANDMTTNGFSELVQFIRLKYFISSAFRHVAMEFSISIFIVDITATV